MNFFKIQLHQGIQIKYNIFQFSSIIKFLLQIIPINFNSITKIFIKIIFHAIIIINYFNFYYEFLLLNLHHNNKKLIK